MHAASMNGVLKVGVAESIRDAGRSFLDSTCGALESLAAVEDFDSINNSRIFAYDGRHAAILVTENHTRVFRQHVSAGLYDLSVSGKPRSDWQGALAATATSVVIDNMEHDVDGAVGSMEPLFRSCPLWASVVHMTPLRVSVHQRCAGGAMEGFAFQNSRDEGKAGVGSTCTQEKHEDIVQDAYVIFGARPPDSMRFVQHSLVITSEHSCDFAESQPRVTASKCITPLKRRKKDPHRPRGYVSAFNYFVKARRAAYVRDEQGLHNNEINKKLGKDWKKATVEEKKVYNAQSHADKLRYLQIHGEPQQLTFAGK